MHHIPMLRLSASPHFSGKRKYRESTQYITTCTIVHYIHYHSDWLLRSIIFLSLPQDSVEFYPPNWVSIPLDSLHNYQDSANKADSWIKIVLRQSWITHTTKYRKGLSESLKLTPKLITPKHYIYTCSYEEACWAGLPGHVATRARYITTL
jgi:hypothetical protein